jgi:putative SOS response-associated peptidase YedK
VCNLYSITTNQEAIRRLFRVVVDNTGNLPPLPGIYPDYPAPIVRNSAGRELIMARWGVPSPPLDRERAVGPDVGRPRRGWGQRRSADDRQHNRSGPPLCRGCKRGTKSSSTRISRSRSSGQAWALEPAAE